MKSYAQFLLEQEEATVQKGKLFIETDDGSYDDWTYSDEWVLLFNLIILWGKHESGVYNYEQFNQKYADFIIANKQIIEEKTSPECYTELEEKANKMKEAKDEEASNSAYESIYETCDKYGILIKCYEETEVS